MQGLLSRNYPGKIYPMNSHVNEIYGIAAYKDPKEIEEPIDLAILTIPEQSVEKAIADCGQKQVKGVTIVTAGFGEAFESGKGRETALARLAHTYGMRLLGPNVSGTFDLHAEFNGSASPAEHLLRTSLAAICQGGCAFYDLLASGFSRGMGLGKFNHTGNECDLTSTDFLELLGCDPDVRAILMCLEVIRDGRRFIEIARLVTKEKPIVVYKAGRTPGVSRAAQSHTGALSGMKEVYQGALHQAGITLETYLKAIPYSDALMPASPMT
jgi:acetyl-CoA synthetase (ADP-forming)